MHRKLTPGTSAVTKNQFYKQSVNKNLVKEIQLVVISSQIVGEPDNPVVSNLGVAASGSGCKLDLRGLEIILNISAS